MSPEKRDLSRRDKSTDLDSHDDPILDKLKRHYDDVAAEPIPDGLLALLEKLDEAEKKR